MAADIAPYLTSDQLFQIVDTFNTRYSAVRVFTLPEAGGRFPRLIHVTKDANDPTKYPLKTLSTTDGFANPQSLDLPEFSPAKVGVLIVGGQHGDEYGAPEALIDVAEALARQEEFVCKDFRLPAARIVEILGHLEIFIVPLLNVRGRDRKEREAYVSWNPDIDPNRNWPFVWNRSVYVTPVESHLYYRPGVTPYASEGNRPSTAEIVQLGVMLIDLLPVNLFIDAHTEIRADDNSPGGVSYPWDIEDTGNNPADSFLGIRGWGGPRADGLKAGPYKEYLPPATQAAHQRYVAAIKAATAKAYYAFSTIAPVQSYQGTAQSYAQSRDICRMRALDFEMKIDQYQQPASEVPGADDQWKQKQRDAIVQLRSSYATAILATLDAFVDDIHAGRVQRPVPRQDWFAVDPAQCPSEPQQEPKEPSKHRPAPRRYFSLAPLWLFAGILAALVAFYRTIASAMSAWWVAAAAAVGSPSPPAATALSITLAPYTFRYIFVGGPGQQIGEFGFSWRSNGGAGSTVSLQIKSHTYGWSPVPGMHNKPPVGAATWQWVPQPGQTLWFRALVQDGANVAYSAEQQFQ